jgi:polyvinyl alcohol dehydrogenase (cytochrome)
MSHFGQRWILGSVCMGLFVTVAGVLARSDDDGGGDDWPMFGHDAQGTRFDASEHRLRTDNIGTLKVLWNTATPGVVSGTPVVSGNTVFAGDTLGNVFALRADDGTIRWQTNLPGAAFTATATVMQGRVVIGDQANAFIYGLDKGNGKLLWKIQPNTFGRPAVWGSGTQVGKYLAIGIASNDEGPPPPFLSRGSLVLLDPQDGTVVWQTYTISDADYANGSTGASIWSTPVLDGESNTIYAGTGNNFTQPPNGTSDAIMAFDAGTGQIKWVNQRTKADVWTPVFPLGPDADFGDSPQLYTLPDGTKVVGEGQKNGVYHVLNAATGQAISARQFIPGGLLGGMYTDSAVANGVVFAPGNNLAAGTCSLFAITGDAKTILWQFETQGIEANGVAVANGIVFFKSFFDPNLYAFKAGDGTRLAAVPIGSSNSGVSISRGRVFVGLGDIFEVGFGGPGGIVGLGIDD